MDSNMHVSAGHVLLKRCTTVESPLPHFNNSQFSWKEFSYRAVPCRTIELLAFHVDFANRRSFSWSATRVFGLRGKAKNPWKNGASRIFSSGAL